MTETTQPGDDRNGMGEVEWWLVRHWLIVGCVDLCDPQEHDHLAFGQRIDATIATLTADLAAERARAETAEQKCAQYQLIAHKAWEARQRVKVLEDALQEIETQTDQMTMPFACWMHEIAAAALAVQPAEEVEDGS